MQVNGIAPSTLTEQSYEMFDVKVVDKIAIVSLNRPNKSNAVNEAGWRELGEIFTKIDKMPEVRVAILNGNGKNFCAGIDLAMLMSVRQNSANDCEGRTRENIRDFVFYLQECINAIEKCRKPVLAAIHGACVGGAIDIITACDMRYATNDAFFAIAEIDMGMVADLGTLQRLPKLIGDGLARELAYTGRRVYGPEGERINLINKAYADYETMMADVMELARMIASKSPLSIRGTKQVILHTRDHSVADGLEYIAAWNAGLLLSNDLNEAFMAKMQKRMPEFKD